MVEVEKEYASKGVAGAALGTGIAGLSLGAINSVCSLLANRNATATASAAPAAPTMPVVPYGMGYAPGGCSDNMPVSRYELEREQKLAAKDSEIALLKANTYNDQKNLQVYAYIDAQLKEIRKEQSDQAVRNQRVEDAFALVRQDVECVRSDLSKDIKIEAERRCCGDNAIVTYSNATFYPKMVADVTTGTGTTAQTLYNPLPKCGGGCCNGN